MRNFLALLLAGTLAVASLSAQAQQTPDQLRARAMENTRLLANRIALDDARSVRVRHLTYDRLVQEDQVTTMYNDDPAMRESKLRAAEQEYTEKLKGLLTAVQFERYQTLVAAGTVPTTTRAVSVLKPATATPEQANSQR